MIRVVLLGGGNLATHLLLAFSENSTIELIQIYNRTLATIEDKQSLAPITDSLENLLEADLYIIATSDTSIEEISKKIDYCTGLIVHTSGAMPRSVLKNSRNGVFYPLQSFSKETSIDFSKIPFCIETGAKEDYILLETFATSLSKKTYAMSSEQRKTLHIAAVFVNNFVNHMYLIGEDICKENNIPFEVLHPLIKETAEKVQYISPRKAQTGPAIRGDNKTVALHEKELNIDQKTIYKLLSKAISNNK